MSHRALKIFRNGRFMAWVFVLMFALPGIISLFLHVFTYHSVLRAESWPTVDAVVRHWQFSRSSELSYGLTGNHVYWHTDVSLIFDYTVDGHSYSSTCFYASGQSPSVGVANDYPVGQHFLARYNPSNPSEAVVEPGSVGRMYLIAGLILIGVAVFALVCNYRDL